MNFLAHIYLSGDDFEIRFGNFIGDFVKGNYKSNYPEKIALGISLHRKIDEFTDKHPIFKKSKTRLRDIYGHYPPVIIDVFYDHILAKNWDNYHHTPLASFTQRFYKNCATVRHLIPDRSQELFRYLVKQDWLYHYSKIDGIKRTLEGLSRRSSFHSNMERATEDLIEHLDAFDEDFKIFFQEAIDFSNQYIRNHS